MPNTNCLEGMRCPNKDCGSEEPLHILTTTWVTVYDTGSGVSDIQPWDDDSGCACLACGHSGTVSDFKSENQEVTP